MGKYLEDKELDTVLETYFEPLHESATKLPKVEDNSKENIYTKFKSEVDKEIEHLLKRFLNIRMTKIAKDPNHEERNKNYIGKSLTKDQLLKATNIYKISINDYKGTGDYYDGVLDIFINFNKYINEYWTDQSYILQSYIVLRKNGKIGFVEESEETT